MGAARRGGTRPRRGTTAGGRPLSQTAAWRSILAGRVDFDDPWRYANRGALERYSGGSGVVSALVDGHDSVVSEMHAAAAYADLLDLLVDEAQLYIEAGWQHRVDSLHPLRGLAADPLGRVLVRALSPDIWAILRVHAASSDGAGPRGEVPLLAPAAAVALDLCISPHPRDQRVAVAIIEGLR